MNENEKTRYAKKILHLLEIDVSEDEELASLLLKIRSAVVLPASQTEGEIMVLTNQIVDELVSACPSEKIIVDLYEKLFHEVTYLPFD